MKQIPRRILRRMLALARDLEGSARRVEADWQSKMKRGDLTIGRGVRLNGASLVAADSTGCVLEIGQDSNLECAITLEKDGASIRIGARTHVGGGTVLAAAREIKIGDDVLIAFGALIMDHASHSLQFSRRKDDVVNWIQGRKDWAGVSMDPVTIGDKSWVGARAIVLKGVNVGEGAIVGAGSVVTRDVSPWTIVAGNPARVIREIPVEER